MEHDIESRKELINLNPSNKFFTLKIFQNSIIFVINVTVSSIFSSYMSGWNLEASAVSSQKTFKQVSTFCLSIGLGLAAT